MGACLEGTVWPGHNPMSAPTVTSSPPYQIHGTSGLTWTSKMACSDVPEVRFYLLSPAAEVLRVAEEALPILRLGDAEDPRPQMRPLANEQVPWSAAERRQRAPSALWAVIYVVATLLPTTALLWSSRLGRRRTGNRRA